jgi:hypothetical protein
MRGAALIPGAFRERATYTGPAAAPWNAAAPLIMPSPYDPNEFVHPDVLFFPRGWNGYRYWMGVTPYPNGADASENPSVLASNDRITWVLPPGATNPVVPNAGGYNSDPDLIFDGGLLHMVYRRVASGDEINVLSSADGRQWTAPTLLWNDGSTLSPAIVHDGTQWVCYFVDGSTTPYSIRYRTAAVVTGPWSASALCTYPTPTYGTTGVYAPWHLNAFRHNDKTYLLINENAQTGRNLRFAVSADGVTFAPAAQPVMVTQAGWDGTSLYRASAVVRPGGDRLWMWYSALGPQGWRVGYTEIPTDNPGYFPT